MKLCLKQENGMSDCIIVKIGKKEFKSWWDSPPKSIDHVCINYLNNRYPCITTENRVVRFKQEYKKLFIKN